MASSATPCDEYPWKHCLDDNIYQSFGTGPRAEAMAFPATVRGQSDSVSENLLTSLSVGLEHLTDEEGEDCATMIPNKGDGNCQSYAILNGMRAAKSEVRKRKRKIILPFLTNTTSSL